MLYSWAQVERLKSYMGANRTAREQAKPLRAGQRQPNGGNVMTRFTWTGLCWTSTCRSEGSWFESCQWQVSACGLMLGICHTSLFHLLHARTRPQTDWRFPGALGPQLPSGFPTNCLLTHLLNCGTTLLPAVQVNTITHLPEICIASRMILLYWFVPWVYTG